MLIALSGINDALSVQQNYLLNLRERLSLVLGPEPAAQDCPNGLAKSPNPPSLAEIISALEQRLRAHNAQIQDLTHRLEL